jgi:carboxypeptidase C (cathepsin A)
MLLPSLLEQMPILIYSGDKDLMCAGVGVEAMIEDLEWNGAQGFVRDLPLYPFSGVTDSFHRDRTALNR